MTSGSTSESITVSRSATSMNSRHRAVRQFASDVLDAHRVRHRSYDQAGRWARHQGDEASRRG